MKKITIVLFTVFALTSCGGSTEVETQPTDSTQVELDTNCVEDSTVVVLTSTVEVTPGK